MKPVGGTKIPWSAQRFLQNFSKDHWLRNPMKVKKSNFNFYIYTLFLDPLCINCDDSVLIVQNTQRRKVTKQRVRL